MKNETLHLTDLLFCEFCKEGFGINRGIYNTIDAWFYKQGEFNLIQRRKQILLFLNYNYEMSNNHKFGKGGLTAKLEEYWLWYLSEENRQSVLS